jgi:aryl-alcohol dehydrogenase-like predicted oxidoreductase
LKVRRRKLGRTALCVPEIGFGCGPTAGLIAAGYGDAQCAAVARALELGIDYFDTAPLYGDGRSERTLGRILRNLGAAPLIATKVVLADADFANIRDAILRSVESSLERLGQPRVTLLQLHNRLGMRRASSADFGVGALLSVDDVLGIGGVAETFADLRTGGLVEHFGCSAYGGEMPAVERVVDSGTFDCLSIHYSLLNATAFRRSPPESGVKDYACLGARAAAAGMGVIALRVLEAGLLTGRHAAQEESPRAAGNATNTRLDELQKLLEPANALAPTAIRFALSRPEVATALVGFSSAEQVEVAAAGAAEGPLPAALLSRIEASYASTA